MMTKKDYEMVAAIIRKEQGAYLLALQFADVLEIAYPKFDRGRFLAACAPKGDK